MDHNLDNFLKGASHHLFSDTKEQNGCALITQIKRYSKNQPHFRQAKEKIYSAWIEFAKEAHNKNPEIDLCLLMLSSVSFQGNEQDEIIFWIAPTERSRSHLSLFIHAFSHVLKEMPHTFEIFDQQEGGKRGVIADIFSKATEGEILNVKIHSEAILKEPYALLRYPAGKLNSRKSKISPYLPKKG